MTAFVSQNDRHAIVVHNTSVDANAPRGLAFFHRTANQIRKFLSQIDVVTQACNPLDEHAIPLYMLNRVQPDSHSCGPLSCCFASWIFKNTSLLFGDFSSNSMDAVIGQSMDQFFVTYSSDTVRSVARNAVRNVYLKKDPVKYKYLPLQI